MLLKSNYHWREVQYDAAGNPFFLYYRKVYPLGEFMKPKTPWQDTTLIFGPDLCLHINGGILIKLSKSCEAVQVYYTKEEVIHG